MNNHRSALRANRSFWRMLVNPAVSFHALCTAFEQMDTAEAQARPCCVLSRAATGSHPSPVHRESARNPRVWRPRLSTDSGRAGSSRHLSPSTTTIPPFPCAPRPMQRTGPSSSATRRAPSF